MICIKETTPELVKIKIGIQSGPNVGSGATGFYCEKGKGAPAVHHDVRLKGRNDRHFRER